MTSVNHAPDHVPDGTAEKTTLLTATGATPRDNPAPVSERAAGIQWAAHYFRDMSQESLPRREVIRLLDYLARQETARQTSSTAAAAQAVPLRLAQHLAHAAIEAQVRCELTAFPGESDDFEAVQNRGRCRANAVAIRWEDGFADGVCARHAENATKRGACVVFAQRHNGQEDTHV